MPSRTLAAPDKAEEHSWAESTHHENGRILAHQKREQRRASGEPLPIAPWEAPIIARGFRGERPGLNRPSLADDLARMRANLVELARRRAARTDGDVGQCIVCGAVLGCDCASVPAGFAWWR